MLASDFAFRCKLRVRYAEVDPQGIVFNGHYLTYADVAVTEFFREAWGSYATFVAEHGLDFHVLRSEVDYHSPARFDDELVLCIRGTYKGPRLFWEIAGFRADEHLFTARLTYATVRAVDGRVVRLPGELAGKLALQPARRA